MFRIGFNHVSYGLTSPPRPKSGDPTAGLANVAATLWAPSPAESSLPLVLNGPKRERERERDSPPAFEVCRQNYRNKTTQLETQTIPAKPPTSGNGRQG